MGGAGAALSIEVSLDVLQLEADRLEPSLVSMAEMAGLLLAPDVFRDCAAEFGLANRAIAAAMVKSANDFSLFLFWIMQSAMKPPGC
jgi:hypothetical protein